MRLKRYKEKKISRYFSRGIMIIILSLISAGLLINYFSSRVSNILLPLAEASCRKYVSTIINNSTDGMMFEEELFVIDRDSNNEIKMITYNTYEATKLINTITENIQNSFDKLENEYENGREDFVIEEIPVGAIFNNSFIGNLGPKIKIRTDIVGDVLSELQTEVKPYGINNALVEVSVFLEATARVVLPFVSKEIKITNAIPISINIVNGTIPDAYISTYK